MQWEQASKDAKECLRLDPSFVKGYYRLALALKELQDYATALQVLQQGLAVAEQHASKDSAASSSSSNTADPLHKLLRQIQQLQKQQETTAAAASNNNNNKSFVDSDSLPLSAASSNLDDASARELDDLQVQAQQTRRDLSLVENQLLRLARDQRLAEVTLEEVAQLPVDTNCYRSIGKIFVKTSQDRVQEHLNEQTQSSQKRLADLTQKKDYLERRMKSQVQNMKDILGAAA